MLPIQLLMTRFLHLLQILLQLTSTPTTTTNMSTTWGVLTNLDYATAQGLLGADVDAAFGGNQNATKSFAMSPTGDATIVKMILVSPWSQSDGDGNVVTMFNIVTGSSAFSKDIDITLMNGITPGGMMGEVAEYGIWVSNIASTKLLIRRSGRSSYSVVSCPCR